MDNPNAQFLFDFGSPNAYFCHKVLPGIEARTGVSIARVPILLGGLFKLTQNRSPMEAFAGIPNKLAYEALERQRFVERHSLTAFKANVHFPVNTLLVMRGAVAARRLDRFEAYVETVFSCMWEQSLDMSDVAVVHEALAKAGLEADLLMAAAQDPEVKAALVANTQAASDRGAFGSPTFFVGNEIFFGKDRLRDVEEEIVRQGRSSTG